MTLTRGASPWSPMSRLSSSSRPTNSAVSGRRASRCGTRGGRASGRDSRAAAAAPPGKLGIAPEDPLMQFGQRRPGFGALLFDQAAARLPVEAEGVTRPAAPVQGGHLVGDERLVQRILQPADWCSSPTRCGVPAERQLTLDALQDGSPALLFEAVAHPRHPVAVDARQGRAAPQFVRLAQQGGRLVMVAASGQPVRLPAQPAELMQVHRLGIDVEHIAAGAPGKLDAVTDRLPQRCAEPGEVGGEALPGLGRWPGVPQPVDEGLCRDYRPRRQQQDGKDAALPGRPQVPLPAGRPELDRPENPKFHDRLASSTACASGGWSNGMHGTIPSRLIPAMAFSHSVYGPSSG